MDLFFWTAGDVGPGSRRLFLNTGAGAFVDHTTARLPLGRSPVGYVALADPDRDGDLDVLETDQDLRVLVNRERQIRVPEMIALGQAFRIELYARPGYARSSHTAHAWIAFGLAPRPIDLGPPGSLFLDPAASVPFPPVSVPRVPGLATLSLSVPNVPAAVGLCVFTQALIVDNANPVTGSGLTGYTRDRILN